MVNEQRPLPQGVAWRAVGRCVLRTGVLLARGRVHLPRDHVGMRIGFADGSQSRVYRETVVDGPGPLEPCLLVVGFRLRAVRGRGHDLFRWESLLNTPLFVGFPGLVSKLWLAADAHGLYRGLYEWDGAERAVADARALWRVLALVSDPRSIHYSIVPGLRRDQVLDRAQLPDGEAAVPDPGRWWQPVAVA